MDENEEKELLTNMNGMGAALQTYMAKTDRHQEILEKLEGWMQQRGMIKTQKVLV